MVLCPSKKSFNLLSAIRLPPSRKTCCCGVQVFYVKFYNYSFHWTFVRLWSHSRQWWLCQCAGSNREMPMTNIYVRRLALSAFTCETEQLIRRIFYTIVVMTISFELCLIHFSLERTIHNDFYDKKGMPRRFNRLMAHTTQTRMQGFV